jgi:hypothetical protein
MDSHFGQNHTKFCDRYSPSSLRAEKKTKLVLFYKINDYLYCILNVCTFPVLPPSMLYIAKQKFAHRIDYYLYCILTVRAFPSHGRNKELVPEKRTNIFTCILVVCVWIYIYIYIYIYIGTCVHLSCSILSQICIHTYVCVCTYRHIGVCVYKYMYVCLYVYSCMCVYIYNIFISTISKIEKLQYNYTLTLFWTQK